jgi:hypothetical protein
VARHRERQGGDGCDVKRVDGRDGHVGERLAHNVPCAQLGHPLQGVGVKAARPQNRPGQPGVADGYLGAHVVAHDRVGDIPARDRPRRQQDDAIRASAGNLGQQPGHVGVAAQQEHASHSEQCAGEAVGLAEIAGDHLDA